MSLTYTTFQNALVNLAPFASAGDARFAADLPNIIDDAELRCYRDLDLLNTITKDATAALTAGNRNFNLPSANGTFVVVENINVVTPATQANPDLGTRNPLTPVSREVLNFLWPAVTGSTVPTYFAMLSQSAVVVGPWPDAGYQVEVVGTVRPTPLSAGNSTTLLSTYFPDLFLAAAMVRVAGLMKDYGSQSDDPKLAVTWDGHYQTLLTSAKVEEARKKFTGQGWSSKQPAELATPART